MNEKELYVLLNKEANTPPFTFTPRFKECDQEI